MLPGEHNSLLWYKTQIAFIVENTYLYLEPSRYVFRGAELVSDDDEEEESDEENDSFSSNASEINESPIMEDVTSQQTIGSEDDEMQSSESIANCEEENNVGNERRLVRQWTNRIGRSAFYNEMRMGSSKNAKLKYCLCSFRLFAFLKRFTFSFSVSRLYNICVKCLQIANLSIIMTWYLFM